MVKQLKFDSNKWKLVVIWVAKEDALGVDLRK